MSKKQLAQKEYMAPEASVVRTEITSMLCQSTSALVIDDVESTSVESFVEDGVFTW